MNDYNFLDNKNVVYFQSDRFDFDQTMKIEQIKQKITQWITQYFKGGRQIFPYFIDNCEVLQQDSKGWKKGKIRIYFEFIPNEEETAEKETKSNQGTLDVID